MEGFGKNCEKCNLREAMEIIISEEEREVYFCLECFEGDEKELKNVLAHKDNQGREKEREEEL